MAAMAETGGPVSRSMALAKYLKSEGIETATCIAEDVNYRKIYDITNYFLNVPTPMGVPKVVGKYIFPIVQKLGLTSKKTVRSFDEVLLLTGNLNYRYLKKSVESIRQAIRQFNPDILYSEFNISALIAAKLENIRLYITTSFPTRHNYANNPKLSKELNRLLKEYNLDAVESALQLFDYADKKFCLSIEELEPLKDAIFCGVWKTVKPIETRRNKILVYMGNGTISARKLKNEITKAFNETNYEVFITSSYLKACDNKNIHIAKRWGFDNLLNESVLFINHGGQNSVIQGLLYGVPQMIVPGKVFERKYNAKSVSDKAAAIVLSVKEFSASIILQKTNDIVQNSEMKINAEKLGQKLSDYGGFVNILKEMK